MSEPSSSILSLSRRYDQALAALTPFFMADESADVASATAAAKSVLDCHAAATPQELQLATESVAYGMASLACLCAGAAVREDSIDEMMTWQNIAIKFTNQSLKIGRALDARQKERTKNPKALTAARPLLMANVAGEHTDSHPFRIRRGKIPKVGGVSLPPQ